MAEIYSQNWTPWAASHEKLLLVGAPQAFLGRFSDESVRIFERFELLCFIKYTRRTRSSLYSLWLSTMGLFVHEPIQTTQSNVALGIVRRHTDDVVTHRRDDVVTYHKADAVSHHTGDAVRCPSVTHSVNPVTRWCSHSSRPSRLSTDASEMGTIWLTSSYSLVMYKSTMYSVYFFKSLSLAKLR